MPQSELTLAMLGDTSDLTDRERLALAFGILREQGWFAPVEWSTSLCCSKHGWEKVTENFGVTPEEWMALEYAEEPPSIWWHAQADSLAFYGSLDSPPMSKEMEDTIDRLYQESGEDEEIVADWIEAHADEIEADEVIERTTKLVHLVGYLALHFSGGMENMKKAVTVLRSVGLCVSEPVQPNFPLVVHPSITPFVAKWRTVDDRIALWFNNEALKPEGLPNALLSQEDARGLIRMLQSFLTKDGTG